MCGLIENLHAVKAREDLTNEDIARRMSTYLGEPVDQNTVGNWFRGTAGVPLEKLGALLHAFGLTAVSRDSVIVEPEKYKALKVFAREALERGIEKAQVGGRLHDISWAIQSCAEEEKFSVVRDYVAQFADDVRTDVHGSVVKELIA